MKTYGGLVVLAVLTIILTSSCLATELENNKNFDEKPKASLIPHVRTKRGFDLSGRGSLSSGYLRESYTGPIYQDDKNRIDASEFIQHNWDEGSRPTTTFGLGGKFTRNIYRSKDSSLEISAGYDKTFTGRHRSGQYMAGLQFKYG